MDFRFIEDGTRLDIQQKDAPEAPKYFGVFEQMVRGVTFLLSCDVLIERMEELDPACIYTFTFFRGADMFTFDGRLGEQGKLFQNDVVSVTATSLISSFSRRGSHRVRVQLPVTLFDEETSFADGVTHDLSRGGLTFLSNEKLPLQLRKVYTAEFLVNNLPFRLPVEYVRGSERGLSPLYRYDYAFMYSGENLTDDLNRMTLALFEHQLKGNR